MVIFHSYVKVYQEGMRLLIFSMLGMLGIVMLG